MVLEAAGSGMDRVVNTTCLLGDVSYFPELNALFAESIAASPPARMAMQVLPRWGCSFLLGASRLCGVAAVISMLSPIGRVPSGRFLGECIDSFV